ncbi:hypothetical protein AVEN_50598-1 [Araneus ventricosus]|uniref:Uncharacterized protein n=1 Tax=Araneus ventricosus TaxID=182803 RepID=A0A4Y2ASC2_ARAVE|nr:hypothetical protein AVEN_50598-1 [Araneus ventricosus]
MVPFQKPLSYLEIWLHLQSMSSEEEIGKMVITIMKREFSRGWVELLATPKNKPTKTTRLGAFGSLRFSPRLGLDESSNSVGRQRRQPPEVRFWVFADAHH